jgi:hypothetical protein
MVIIAQVNVVNQTVNLKLLPPSNEARTEFMCGKKKKEIASVGCIEIL